MKWLGLLAVFLTMAAAAAPTPDALPTEFSNQDGAALVKEGGKVYALNCARCHGDHDKASLIAVGAPDLRRGVYRFRSTASGSPPTDTDLWRTIAIGIPYSLMPAFGKLLPRKERWAVLQYLKSLSEKFQAPAVALPIPAPEKADGSGALWYITLRCFDCHGTRGKGDGPQAATLTDETGQKLRPADFTRREFKSGPTPADLYRTLQTGLDGTPMAAWDRDALLVDRDGQILQEAGKPKRYPIVEALGDQYPEATKLRLRLFLDALPGHEDVAKWSESVKNKISQSRRWQLVHYILSLSSKEGKGR